MHALPSSRRLLVCAVVLPAAVAVSNQAVLEFARASYERRVWLYPWLALSTAVLSWCVGRYLSPAWLRWLVFGWVLVLLDALTIAACLGGPVERYVGYVLVASQISLIVLWAVLADVNWQWRVPVVLVATAVVVAYSGSFYWGIWGRRRWGPNNWDFLMLLTATVMLLVCGALRTRGFRLVNEIREDVDRGSEIQLQRHQFGLKHMLIWSTALVPILLVARGLNLLLLKRLGGPDLFPLFVVALAIAMVNLIAIWSVLGRGYGFLRLIILMTIPFFLAVGLGKYLSFVEASHRRSFSMATYTYTSYADSWWDSLVQGIADAENSWTTWLWLNAALLAALLLFLRASGYRLMRISRGT